MKNQAIFIFLVMTTVLHLDLAQLNSVPIKSHRVLTKVINHNNLPSIYDNNVDTIGSFYSANEQEVEVEFDLGKDYLIEHVMIRMKQERKVHQLSLSVGNTLNGVGGLLYVCGRPNESVELYKCTPVCQSPSTPRQGIIGRRFVLKLMVPGQWISVYDMTVFAGMVPVSDDISSHRLVLPMDCSARSWLLTDKSAPANLSVPTTTPTHIFLDKPYLLTEVIVQFDKTPPQSFDIEMVSGLNKKDTVTISLSQCQSQISLFACKITGKTISSRQVTLATTGLIKIFLRGKPVFYPQLKIKTSLNTKERLRMTCEYSACDLSVHSDCSAETIGSGVKYDCVNKRLIRQPMGSDKDSYVIVNQGKVESVWQNTKFSVDTSTDENMVVSMPRSYQYFGHYQCACIVADKMNTELISETTALKETDFFEDLIFETGVQYKLSDSDDAIYYNVSNKIIYLSKSSIETTFLPVKITMYSLIAGNHLEATYPVNEKDYEKSNTDRYYAHSIKAFKDIEQSWYVSTHKYEIDEIFPELINGQVITINCTNKIHNIQQMEFIRLLDADKVQQMPSIWSTVDGNKTMQINIVYANNSEAQLYHTEKTCTDTSKKLLATFTKDICHSNDARVSCPKFVNATFLSFKDEQNFAKDITLDIINAKTNVSIAMLALKKDVILNQDDVVMKHRYTSLSSSTTNPSINTINVEIEVISKKISDFIPCGKAKLKILFPNKETKEMILQKSIFSIDVDMTSSNIKMTIIASIEDARGQHEAIIQITDPTTFSVTNVEFQGDKILNLLWQGIDEIATEFLQSYELKIETTIVACNTTTSVLKSIPKSQTSGAKNRYQTPMSAINEKHLTKLTVTVQPVFMNNKRGQSARIEKQFGTIESSTILLNNDMLTTERTISVMPSQSELSCDIMDVELSVTSTNVEKLEWKKISLDNMKYKITNLVPGRNYELTAQVLYKFGPQDTKSKPYSFETADSISILKTKHVASINEKVSILCTAEIGPEDRFKKKVEWLRADKSQLPAGVISHTVPTKPNEATLIMENALADHSGAYGCFARPSASTGAMTITITVNDLTVVPPEQKMDFSKRGETVSVTCSSSVGDKNTLEWVDPLGVTISETESDKFAIKKSVTDQNLYKSTLMIKNVGLGSSGIYKCHKSVGDISANKEFLLYGYEKMHIRQLPESSLFIGEKLRLRCIGEAGMKSQKAIWEHVTIKDDPIILMNTSLPEAPDETTRDIEILNSLVVPHVTCSMVPSFRDSEAPLKSSFTINLMSKVVVISPKEVNIGDDVKLICLGYPDEKNMQLKWTFYSKNESSTGTVVKTSDGKPSPKSYEPIKLELNFTKIENQSAGRYECTFKRESRNSGKLPSKTVQLEIMAASKSLGQENPKKSVYATLVNGLFTLLIAVVSLTINHRS